MAEAAASPGNLSPDALLRPDQCGLYCARGRFHIDPWKPVDAAVITHAHADHARWGSKIYYVARPALALLRQRLGPAADLRGFDYGERFRLGETDVSFHPAGHILGSAQVRVECEGKVWVVSGDFKRGSDPTCLPFEVVPCDVFITEATFALPIYRWDSGEHTAREILKWWDENIHASKPSLLFCYALGKAQRILGELAKLDRTRQAYIHGAMTRLTKIYRDAGVEMLPTQAVSDLERGKSFAGELILAPPSAYRSLWTKRFKGAETGFASGWMRVRGTRRRKGYDRGFVLSDHADWGELLRTVRETGARHVLPTHGSTQVFSRYLNEIGIFATPLEITAFEGEEDLTPAENAGVLG